MRLVLLGCPGAGKGTQAKILSQKYGLAHIATGDLFRAEIAAKTPLGLKVADYLRSGTLVPDNVVVDLVASKLEGTAGWILDGFPRTLQQAQALDQYLKKSGQTIDTVFYMNIKESHLLQRLTSRRACVKCGELYNLETRPPAVDGKCDKCGSEIKQREDDTEATVKKRLMVYEDLTRPLIAYYRSESAFHEVDASQSMEKVTKDLAGAIEGAGVKS